METRFNIVELFDRNSAAFSDKLAIIHGKDQISFGDLAKAIDRTAQHFLRRGIRKGDRVLVFVPMGVALYRVVLALFKIGAVAVFLDEWVSVGRLGACCRVAQCRALVGTPKTLLLAWWVGDLRRIPIRLGLGYGRRPGARPIPETTADDTALITFTTGSTGVPKAAIRTHGLLRAQFGALEPLIQPRPQDIALTTLPIVLLINLAAGVTSVIADYNGRKPEAMKAAKILGQIRKLGVNCLLASPFFVEKLAEQSLKEGLHHRTISKIFVGGAPVFPHLARRLGEAFPAARIEIVYGSTEAEPISSLGSGQLLELGERGRQRGLPVGKPHEGTEVKIIEIREGAITVNALEALERKTGEIGEIIVSGDHVLSEYLHNESARERNKIWVGNRCWHRTGDSGFRDGQGNLFLTGRCASLIYHEGKTLAPFICESFFQETNGVEIGTILALPGRGITSVLELEKRGNKNTIAEQISTRFPEIDSVFFVKKMPRDPRHHSKIDYDKLRKLLAD